MGLPHQSLPWATWIKSTPYHPISSRSILILFSHLQLDLTSGFFPLGMCSQVLAILIEGAFVFHYWSLWNTIYLLMSTRLMSCLLHEHTTPMNMFSECGIYVGNTSFVNAYLNNDKEKQPSVTFKEWNSYSIYCLQMAEPSNIHKSPKQMTQNNILNT